MLLVLATYIFIAWFVESPPTRGLALTLAILGGGLGWVVALAGQTEPWGNPPLEFYVPEGFSFLVVLGLPHIALGRAALLLGLVALFVALRCRDWRWALLAGLAWNLVGLMVSFYLAIIYMLLATWSLALWVRQRRLAVGLAGFGGLAAGLTLPLFAYNAWLFVDNAAFAQWSRQNQLPSPHLAHYLLAYGVWIMLGWVGLRWAWRRAQRSQQAAHALLVSWVVAMPLLVYLPVNVQRRLAEGVIVPLSILVAVGLRLGAHQAAVLGKGRHWRFRWARGLALVLLLPSSALLLLVSTLSLATPNPPAFRPVAELEAMDWLNRQAAPGAVVLAAQTTGNYLPIRTNLRSFLGHGPETLYSDEKTALVARFYAGAFSPAERDAFYERYAIRYVMWAPLSVNWAPAPPGKPTSSPFMMPKG
ncbi:MAG: hypothetical protein HC915_08700 [Anaerolineae bacterium]|nr:hypothetical protein [Anaerolineae bacterium]